MEDAVCICFYSMLCCALCCPPLKPPLTSEPSDDVIVKNPGSVTGNDKGTQTLQEDETLKEGVIS
jgi:hypothetical protein